MRLPIAPPSSGTTFVSRSRVCGVESPTAGCLRVGRSAALAFPARSAGCGPCPSMPKPRRSPARDRPERLFDDPGRRAGGGGGSPRSGRTCRTARGTTADRTWYTSHRLRPNRDLVLGRRDRTARCPATGRSDGTTTATLSADGTTLWWFDDHDGDEFGCWRSQPFGTGPRARRTRPLPDVSPGYPAGLQVGSRVVVAGFADDDGSRVHLSLDGGPAAVVYRHAEDASVGALTTDETIWVLAHAEHGDARYPALRAISVSDGRLHRPNCPTRRARPGPAGGQPGRRRPAGPGRSRTPRAGRVAAVGSGHRLRHRTRPGPAR